MSKTDIVANLSDVVKTQVLTDKTQITEVLKDNKIIVSILKGPQVLVKVIKVSKVAPKQRVLSNETVEELKNAKKLLKNNVDLIYLITLLAKVKDLLSNLDVKNLNVEGSKLIKSVVEDAVSKLRIVDEKLMLK